MYLTHATGVRIAQQYLSVSRFAQEIGKPFMMFETNSASCGGFPGISDAFAAALWALDYGLTLAYSNFTGALFHVGGQNVYYNVSSFLIRFPTCESNLAVDSSHSLVRIHKPGRMTLTCVPPAPPSNQTTFRQWSVGECASPPVGSLCLWFHGEGPMYYAVLAMTEVLGRSNQSQVIDLGVNNDDQSTPGYAIYESGVPMRVALFNYLDDASRAHDLSVTISVGGGETGQPASTPPSVRVKYLLAEHVTAKTNLTWAGQTLGANFKSDGRLQGEELIVNVPCNMVTNTCTVTVPAPGFALVFLNDKAYQDSAPSGNTITFATTARTRSVNTVTIDPKVLETSNGHSGKDRVDLKKTSKGRSRNGAGPLKEGLTQLVMTGLGVGFGVMLFTLL